MYGSCMGHRVSGCASVAAIDNKSPRLLVLRSVNGRLQSQDPVISDWGSEKTHALGSYICIILERLRSFPGT
jgi:hypothetical protein